VREGKEGDGEGKARKGVREEKGALAPVTTLFGVKLCPWTQQSILHLVVNCKVFTINICCFIAQILLQISIFTSFNY